VLVARLSPERTAFLLDEADRHVEEVAAFLGLEPPRRPARVMLFDSRASLTRYLRAESPNQAGSAAACFISDDQVLVALARHARQAETLRTMRHELVHYLLAAHFRRLPPWLNEGLAKFFELGPSYGRPHPGCLRTLDRMNGGERPGSLRRLVALPEGVHLGKRRYAEAWALVHLLVMDPRWGVPALMDYLAAVDSGADQVGQFKASFGCPPEELAPALQEHLRALRGR